MVVKMKKTVLLLLVLMSFTVYLKSGKTFKSNGVDISNAAMVVLTVDNKTVYVPWANIEYIKED